MTGTAHLQQEGPHRRVQHLVGDAGLVQSDPLLHRATPGGAHGQKAGDDPRLLAAAHVPVGVEHHAHQRGAAPGEAADENEGGVFRKVLVQGEVAIGRAQVELHPPVAAALWGALDAAHAQVEDGGGAEEQAAQQEAQPAVPHCWRPRGSATDRGLGDDGVACPLSDVHVWAGQTCADFPALLLWRRRAESEPVLRPG